MYVLVIVVLLRSKGYSVVFEALCSKGMSINITSKAFTSYLLLCVIVLKWLSTNFKISISKPA